MICVEFEGYRALEGSEYCVQSEARSSANHGGVKDDVGSHCGTKARFLEFIVVLVHLPICSLESDRQSILR